jgi:hypothetical protein
MNVTANNGGLWRSVNPDADPDGIEPPRFNHVNTDLPRVGGVGVMYNYAGFTLNPVTFLVRSLALPQIGTANITTPPNQPLYFNQLWALADTLAAGTTQTAPAAGATSQGIRLNKDDLTMTVTLSWVAMPGATNYEYQVADDAKFESKRANVSGLTTGQVVDLSPFIPNKIFNWRVRAVAPILSPWSTGRSFTTSTTELIEMVVDLRSPAMGATDVGLRPTFSWSAVIGANAYEWEIAKDSAFAIPVERAGGELATVNAVVLRHDLDYNTTYYWRVRARTVVKPPTFTAWATGIFTTKAEAVVAPPAVVTVKEQAPPTVIQVPAPAAIPSYLLWAIVIIGAVLVIAVIVLIVRTRRVP